MAGKSDDDPLSTGGAFDVLAGLAGDASDPILGRKLGDYQTLDLIAAGGMGRVYRARRADGSFEREVAVKVSGSSGLSGELLSRFVQEQKVLAGLNHPNICQLYDAQVTTEGWPYIVMELVDGDSIVEFCENNRLNSRSRLKLLIDVVDAVAYAHSRLVVHRDIKPANVLVAGNGQAKLLDFGIAKLLESDGGLTHATPMTPRYASPEQLLGQPITIASDIAQLGLLIYEVLAGHPLNPSETLASAIQRTSEGRSLRVDPARAPGLPREVLPIVEHCLRTDAQDRYADANSLKADLEAYLGGYPVAAVGQSTAYRLRKFLLRNVPTVATASIALLAMVVGVVWYTWRLSIAREAAETQAAAAQIESERANQVSQFLVTLFEAPTPENARGTEVTVQQVLESGIEKVRTELEGQDGLRADLLMTLGRVYNELGDFDKGAELVAEAVDTHRHIDDEDTTRLAKALYTHAQSMMYRGDLDRAADRFKEAIEAARAMPDPTRASLDVMSGALNSLGIALSRLNRFEESEAAYQECIAIKRELYGAGHVETSVPVANYGRLLAKLGRYDDALPLLESSYETAMTELGPYHPWIAPRAINLGRLYLKRGRIDEAGALFRIALDQDRVLYGDTHHYVASSLQNLGIFVYRYQDRAEGVELIEEGLAIEEQTLGDDHLDTNQTRGQLARFYTGMGRYPEAEALLDTARSRLETGIDGDHRYLATLGQYFGELYLATDREDLAVEELRASVEMNERLFGRDSVKLYEPLIPFAEALAATGAREAASENYGRALFLLEKSGEANEDYYARLEALRRTLQENRGTATSY